MYLNKKHGHAIYLLKKGEYENALTLLTDCILEFPESPELFSERGTVYLHMQKKTEALADMDESVRLEPEYSYRYASRAFVKDHFGDTQGAITDYEIAIKLDPEDVIAINNLGLLMEKMGYKEAAKKKFEQADSLLNNQPSMKQKLSELEHGEPKNHPEGIELKAKKLDVNKKETKKEKSTLKLILSIFTKKSAFKEFICFIRNGFKLKSND